MRVQNSPRQSRSAVVTDNPVSRRPIRGGVNEGESIGRQTVGSEAVGRPARRGEAATSPNRTEGNIRIQEGEKAALPTRPSRARRSEPAVNQQEQRALPTRTERRTRTQEYQPQQQQERRVQPQQQERRVRPTESRPAESRPVRTYESRPQRTYESRPAPTYERSSPMQSSPSPRSSGSSGSSGGGRPPRGGN